MKLPGNTGRKESMAAIIAVLGIGILFFCILSLIIFGTVFPEGGGLLKELINLIISFFLMLFCVMAAFLIVRFLFRQYLCMRAYHVKKGTGWEKWQDVVKGEHSDE